MLFCPRPVTPESQVIAKNGGATTGMPLRPPSTSPRSTNGSYQTYKPGQAAADHEFAAWYDPEEVE
jgi:hypothetical protein